MKYLQIAEKYILYTGLFLLPVLFLPIYENIFESSKLAISLFVAITLVIIKVIKSVIRKSLEFNSGKFDLTVLIFMTVFLISGIFASVNRVDSFVFPGTATFAILAGLYYFLVNQLPKKDKDNIIFVMLTSGFVVAVMQITAFVGLNKMIPQLPEFMKSAIFTPFGNILSSIIFLIALMPFLVEKVVNKKEIFDRILAILISLVFMISIASSVYLILPGKETSISMLDYKSSWSIAIDSLKTKPLLGFGPSNYSQAFTRFKPVEFNNRVNWDMRYIQGSSTLMTIVTEIGLLGIIITLFILFNSLKKTELKEPLYVSFAILTLGLLLLPMSPSFYIIFFIMLAMRSDAKDGKLAFFIKRYAISLFSIPVILSLLVAGYLYGMAFYADILFTKSIKEVNNGQGIKAYDLVNKALSINRYSDKYHLFSAGINLALAENIAQKGNELTDKDKETISNLIQQAIAEGKAAVSVNPQKSSNWDALAGIYQTIIAYAKGADQFAVQALNQAIALDPTNPLLRIKLGGLYYSLGDYQSAIEVFKLAILAKPDFANAHYNLAIAYRDNKQIDKAKEQMNLVLQLVELDSKDYQLAKKELESLNVIKEEAPVIEAETLTMPEPTPTPEIDPQLELPTE